ncbi:MAG: hypothetical protein Q9187_007635 [Circinaria calcarea]
MPSQQKRARQVSDDSVVPENTGSAPPLRRSKRASVPTRRPAEADAEIGDDHDFDEKSDGDVTDSDVAPRPPRKRGRVVVEEDTDEDTVDSKPFKEEEAVEPFDKKEAITKGYAVVWDSDSELEDEEDDDDASDGDEFLDEEVEGDGDEDLISADSKVAFFEATLRYILLTMITMAKSLVYSDFCNGDERPILISWWSFLSNVDIEFLMEVYRGAIPRRVQLVLGNPVIKTADLLGLEVKDGWKISSWGVYVDVLTKSTDPGWSRRYVGSGTSKARDRSPI